MTTGRAPLSIGLYYPYLSVEDGDWLRGALVLLDAIAVISPEPTFPKQLTPSMETLLASSAVQIWTPSPAELAIATDTTQRNVTEGAHERLDPREPLALHRGKFTYGLEAHLRRMGMARSSSDSDYVDFEGRVGLLLMLDLARHLSRRENAVPITDAQVPADMYLAGAGGAPRLELTVIRRDLEIAIPDFGDVPLERWLGARDRHREALSIYRTEVHRFSRRLKSYDSADIEAELREREMQLRTRLDDNRSLLARITSSTTTIGLSLLISVAGLAAAPDPLTAGGAAAATLVALQHVANRRPTELTFLAKASRLG